MRLLAALFLFALMLPLVAHADGPPPQAALCGACHGAKGVPANKAIPIIAGQQEGYLYLQLRDYKMGNRKNVVMQAIVAKLERADLHALAAYFATQTWPDLRQPAPSAEVAHRAEVAASSAVCTSCHLSGYIGDSAIPKMAGQSAEYLHATMVAFRSNARANNPWMTALLKTYSDEDIDALSQYLAGM